ncbi:MAG: hypothetical protein ACEQSR_01685 [Candidatus Methylacidiphilales bacterium]
MNNHQIDNELNKLANIQKVDVPIFLFTRIKSKINTQSQQFEPTFVWRISLALVIILLLNAAVVTINLNGKKHENSLAKTMRLTPNNELY